MPLPSFLRLTSCRASPFHSSTARRTVCCLFPLPAGFCTKARWCQQSARRYSEPWTAEQHPAAAPPAPSKQRTAMQGTHTNSRSSSGALQRQAMLVGWSQRWWNLCWSSLTRRSCVSSCCRLGCCLCWRSCCCRRQLQGWAAGSALRWVEVGCSKHAMLLVLGLAVHVCPTLFAQLKP